jgi:hypothetical protein
MEEIQKYIIDNFEPELIHTDINPTHSDIVVMNNNYNKTNHPSRPRSIRVSFDKETGYYMSVESFHWDFGNDERHMIKVAKRYLDAMHKNKIKIRRRPFQKWITFGKDITIE